MKSKASGAPVAGRGKLVNRRPSSKWSRRGCMKRQILLAVFAVVRWILFLARIVRWLFEDF